MKKDLKVANKPEERVIAWFSCGASSAVAAKLAIQEHGDVEVIYQETNAEHPDNERFLSDCEEWFGQKVIRISSDKYHDTWDVWEKRRYIAGVHGAPCTSELKRIVAEKYLNHGYDLEILGYTVEEQRRVDLFRENNPERNIQAILVERGLTKDDCLGMIYRAGIEIPEMYKLGYNHNNCIACPKGGMGHWNLVRKTHPEQFERMAKLERKLNAAILKKEGPDGERIRVFLDELDPDAGNLLTEPSISCGIMCEIEYTGLKDSDMTVHSASVESLMSTWKEGKDK